MCFDSVRRGFYMGCGISKILSKSGLQKSGLSLFLTFVFQTLLQKRSCLE